MSVSSSSWCLGMAAVCNCGTPWTFLLLFCHADIILFWPFETRGLMPILFNFQALWDYGVHADIIYFFLSFGTRVLMLKKIIFSSLLGLEGSC